MSRINSAARGKVIRSDSTKLRRATGCHFSLPHAESRCFRYQIPDCTPSLLICSNSLLVLLGELLLGNSFDSLGKSDPPQYVRDIYSMIIVVGLQAVCPFIHRFLSTIPAKSLQYILNAPNRITQVCRLHYFASESLYLKIFFRYNSLLV